MPGAAPPWRWPPGPGCGPPAGEQGSVGTLDQDRPGRRRGDAAVEGNASLPQGPGLRGLHSGWSRPCGLCVRERVCPEGSRASLYRAGQRGGQKCTTKENHGNTTVEGKNYCTPDSG